MRHDDQDEEHRRCGLCGKILRPYDSISVTDVGERCCRCFNEELAARLGIKFDNTPIAPIVVTDVDGVRHRFEIRSMLVGTGHAMSAREVSKPDARSGYRFEILGDFETDAQDLFKLLHERIRHGLSVRHVEKTEHGWQLTQALRLSGVIEWDPETEGEPRSEMLPNGGGQPAHGLSARRQLDLPAVLPHFGMLLDCLI